METMMCRNCRSIRTPDDFNKQKDGTLARTCRYCIKTMYDRYQRNRGKKCMWCGQPSNGAVYCETHKALMRERMREKRAKREPRKCKECSVEVGAFKQLCATCARRRRIACGRKWSKDRVLKIYKAYGGAFCACCGETTFEFLSLDHRNNDGSSHRKSVGGSGSHVYCWIVKKGYPPGYQILCYNCNVGRYRNGGICPHKSKENP